MNVPDSFLGKLLVSTPEWVYGDVMIRSVSAATDPAPLESTEVAGHVVASLYFLNPGLALGAIGNVDPALSPSIKLLLHVLSA